MRGGWLAVACALAAMVAVTGARAASLGGNCVRYARHASGISLDGNAEAWWSRAEGRYERGRTPSLGAVLVFKPSGHMRVGHVAVVSRIVNPREILVDQANWVRGRVVKNMSVVDASARNDWTVVKVIELRSGVHGRANATHGFIYPRPPRATAGDPLLATNGDDASRRELPVRPAVALGHGVPAEVTKRSSNRTKQPRAQSTVERRDTRAERRAQTRRDRAVPGAAAKPISRPTRATPRIESASHRD